MMNKTRRHPFAAWLLAAALGTAAVAAPGAAPAPALESDVAAATAGFYRLVWSDAGAGVPTYELQESADDSFAAPRTVYEGADQATVLSGKPDGEYRYRVRARLGDGSVTAWSEPVTVTVAHHPLSRAFGFFAAGAIVFLATLVLIVGGNRRAEGEDPA